MKMRMKKESDNYLGMGKSFGIPLKSVECVLDCTSGIIYPMLSDGSTDLTDDGTSLLSVTDEWLDKLSDGDMWKVAEVSDDLGISFKSNVK
jgi:hypothetical protein